MTRVYKLSSTVLLAALSMGCATDSEPNVIPERDALVVLTVDVVASPTETPTCEPVASVPGFEGCTLTIQRLDADDTLLDTERIAFDSGGFAATVEGYDADGNLRARELWERDDLGRYVFADFDDDADGASDSMWRAEFEQGCGASRFLWDLSTDGNADLEETYEYDDEGLMTGAYGQWLNPVYADGGPMAYAHSWLHSATSTEYRWDYDADGVTETTIRTTYDASRAPLLELTDWGDDGTDDSAVAYEQGPLGWTSRQRVALSDHFLNGTPQTDLHVFADGLLAQWHINYGEDKTWDELHTYRYDEAGRLSVVVSDLDLATAAGVDLRTEYSFDCPNLQAAQTPRTVTIPRRPEHRSAQSWSASGVDVAGR